MPLRDEIVSVLKSNPSYSVVIDVIHRHHEQGLSSEESYRQLEQVWLEFGFDDSDEDSEVRNLLEAVMEKVWFLGSTTK